MVALSGLTISSYFQEQYPQALTLLDEMLALEPNDSWTLNYKGQLLSEFAKYQEAVALLQRAIEVGATDTNSYASLGWALENLGPENAPASKKAYQSAIEADTTNLLAHKGVANAHRLLGEVPEAREKYEYVLRESTDTSDFQALRGWCYYCLGKYEEALTSFEQALSVDPDDLSAHFDHALVQLCSGQHDAARQKYHEGLEKAEGLPALKRRGLVFIALDDLREAFSAIPHLVTLPVAQEIKQELEKSWQKVESL